MSTRQPALRYQSLDVIRMAYWEWGQPVIDQPTLLFVHATSFHGRMFDLMIDAFPDHHAISVEMRGHGRSETSSVDHWGFAGRDICQFLSATGLANVIGIGHSMGGHALVDAAAESSAFSQLLLLDPTIAEPGAYVDQIDLTHPPTRRRSRFASPDAMAERLTGKGPFATYHPDMLEKYCRFALAPTDAGEYELLCHPETEATIYAGVHSNTSIHERVRAVEIPVTLMRAKAPPVDRDVVDFSDSPTWPDLASAFPNARDIYLANSNHFFPMQEPARVIETMREVVDAAPAGH